MSTATKSNPSSKNDSPVSDKIKDTLHTSVDTLADKAAQTEKSLRDGTRKGSETLSAKQRELEEKWEQSPVKKYATENPIATAGIAFAAGVLLTSILKRR